MRQRVVDEMEIQEYHNHPAYSKTDISRAKRSTSYVGVKRNADWVGNAAMDMGSAVHMLLLEPEKADAEIAYSKAGTRRGKVWDRDFDNNLGKILLLNKERDPVELMVESVLNHKRAANLLTGGKAEQSFFCRLKGPGYDLPVKCRPDYLPGSLRIADLKTTRNIEPEQFGKDAYNLKYHWSAWLTCKIVRQVTGQHHTYFFVCVENQEPYETVVYQTKPNVLALAEAEIEPVLERLSDDHHRGRFSAIAADNILELTLPGWAFGRMRNFDTF